jgi:hypothetical protein
MLHRLLVSDDFWQYGFEVILFCLIIWVLYDAYKPRKQ